MDSIICLVKVRMDSPRFRIACCRQKCLLIQQFGNTHCATRTYAQPWLNMSGAAVRYQQSANKAESTSVSIEMEETPSRSPSTILLDPSY